jgi:hypothetical protein
MQFYSAIKKSEILLFANKWMELKNIILSEVSQAQKAKKHVFSLICRLYTKTNLEILLDVGHTLSGDHAQEE